MNNIYVAGDFNIKSLGSFYQKDKTTFRVYAPDYNALYLVINNHSYEMHRNGYCFEIALSGDLELVKYHYLSDTKVEFKDPFSYLSDENDSYVLDTSKFNNEVYTPEELYCDPIIYEVSVRDFSSADSYTGKYKSKFLSFTEKGLKKNDYYSIGLDYIKELGITHLQFMPVFEFDSDRTEYNWGYNPVAYNYVHKAYVVDQDNPYAYINELRHTVNVLHQNDIRVTLDVVFNHVYDVRKNDLGKMLNGKLYRYMDNGELANGTLCGSEVDSENPFVQMYIIEMCYRYLKLFDIDGLRFDLMGILDVNTINAIQSNLVAFKKDFIVYGEGWNMGDVLPENRRASIENAYIIPSVKMFNDFFRETMIHYISGNDQIDEDVKKALSGTHRNLNTYQAINYVECHDDFTFFDRMAIYKGDDGKEVNQKRCLLALALVLLSKGTPFIQSGEEFLRTKSGFRNTYNLSDRINKLDWNLRAENTLFVQKVMDLIRFRRKYNGFNTNDKNVRFYTKGRCLCYQAGKLHVFINPSSEQLAYEGSEELHVLYDEFGYCNYSSKIVSISAYSFVICCE